MDDYHSIIFSKFTAKSTLDSESWTCQIVENFHIFRSLFGRHVTVYCHYLWQSPRQSHCSLSTSAFFSDTLPRSGFAAPESQSPPRRCHHPFSVSPSNSSFRIYHVDCFRIGHVDCFHSRGHFFLKFFFRLDLTSKELCFLPLHVANTTFSLTLIPVYSFPDSSKTSSITTQSRPGGLTNQQLVISF